MEDPFKLLDWKGFSININRECITHLRFADDIVVMAKSLEELSTMLGGLNRVSLRVGLRMNMDKTKTISKVHISPTPVLLKGLSPQVILGQKFHLRKSNFEKEVNWRIQLGWAIFGKLRSVFSSKPVDLLQLMWWWYKKHSYNSSLSYKNKFSFFNIFCPVHFKSLLKCDNPLFNHNSLNAYFFTVSRF